VVDQPGLVGRFTRAWNVGRYEQGWANESIAEESVLLSFGTRGVPISG
jgi:hypothetical protein